MKAMAIMQKQVESGRYARESIIRFDEGLIGFSDCKNFVLLENEAIAPFRRLECSDNPEVGFYVLDPGTVQNSYYRLIPEREWETVGLTERAERLAFVICIIGPTPAESTGNFQAPILINCQKMIGRQMILTEPSLTSRQPLL